MKKPIIKFLDKIIIVLLSFLGILSSCIAPAEYGTPYADYEVKGVVKSKENSQPIQNIRVIHQRYADTIYTDAEGNYTLNCMGDLFDYFNMKVEDIDGIENGGEFLTQEVTLKFTKDDLVKKGSGWYEGKYSKTQNFELEHEAEQGYGVRPATF
jgi:putative lipoprotein (rSAM/lipoprotein system)